MLHCDIGLGEPFVKLSGQNEPKSGKFLGPEPTRRLYIALTEDAAYKRHHEVKQIAKSLELD